MKSCENPKIMNSKNYGIWKILNIKFENSRISKQRIRKNYQFWTVINLENWRNFKNYKIWKIKNFKKLRNFEY